LEAIAATSSKSEPRRNRRSKCESKAGANGESQSKAGAYCESQPSAATGSHGTARTRRDFRMSIRDGARIVAT
jgi:hypothetical protein